MELCRACLQPSDGQHNIMNDSIRLGFEELAGLHVKPEDSFPQFVCEQCVDNFTNFLTFKKKVLSSHEYLLEALKELKSSENILTSENICKAEESSVQESYCDTFNDHVESKSILIKAVKRKSKNKLKSKLEKCKARQVIEIDPEKINVLNLTREEQLKNHALEGQKPEFLAMAYKCMKCYKGFNFERKLKSHMDKYHEPNSPYECSICTRTLGGASSLSIHAQHHAVLYSCRVCSVQFCHKLDAIQHYRVTHEGVTPQIPCKFCNKVFRHRSTLNGHIRNHHTTIDAKCDICNKSFKTKDSLLDHMLIHSGEKNYACGACGKRFRLKAQLRAHARAHEALRPHYCARCDVAFKARAALQHHLAHSRRHVPPQQRQTHICPECGGKFSSGPSLKAHLKRHAEARSPKPLLKKVKEEPRPRPFICHLCAQSFTTGASLRRHIMIHTGEKPYSCSECFAAFTQKSTLQTHIKLVHLKIKRKK